MVARFPLDPRQLELLRRACEASDSADDARAVVRREGLTVLDCRGEVSPHPCVQIERDARIAIALLLGELPLESEDSKEPTSRV